MGLLRSPFLLLLVIFIALIGVFLWFRRDIGRMVNHAKGLLKEIDDKYGSFVKKRITLSILEDRSMDDEVDEIIEEAMTVLRPEINDLIAHINATNVSGIKTNHKSPYFRSAVSRVDTLFTKSPEKG